MEDRSRDVFLRMGANVVCLEEEGKMPVDEEMGQG